MIWIDPVKLALRFSKSPPSMCWIQGAAGMILRRWILLISVGWLPPDITSSRSCLA